MLTVWRTDRPVKANFDVRLREGIAAGGINPVTPGTSCSIDLQTPERPRATLTIDPAACDAGLFLARAELQLSDGSGQALTKLPLEVPVTVKASVLLDPNVVLFREASAATVYVRSARGERFSITNVDDSEAIDVIAETDATEFSTVHVLTIKDLAADRSLSVIALDVDVQTENSPLIQRLTIKIQLPLKL